MINLVPDGVVIFLPSYSFLNQLQDVWKQNGTLQRIDAKKKVNPFGSCSSAQSHRIVCCIQLFFEPQLSGEVETILTQYAQAIAKASPQPLWILNNADNKRKERGKADWRDHVRGRWWQAL
jgi:chromosome transmission fidelity protein 1